MVSAHDHLLVEPLIGNFPAFLQLVSPASSALRLAKAQLPTLQSYLESPEAHASGAGHPATKGGPFVDCPPGERDLIAKLVTVLETQRDVLGLASAIDELTALIEDSEGGDLGPLYQRVPDALRGLVELVYDGRHRARVLFRESLMYRGRYDPSPREAVHLTLTDGDVRPFMLSTPRVTTDRGLVVQMPLRSDAVDVLAQSRFVPIPLGELREAVGPEVASSPVFDSFWTEESVTGTPPWTGALRIRYFGHACLVFETAEVTVVADPFVSPRSGPDRFSLRDLPPRIDYCIITHGHADHFVVETLMALRHRIGTVIVPANLGGELLDPSLRLCLEHLGFRDVVEVRDLDEVPIPGGEVVAVPFAGEHGDLAIGAKTTYFVRLGGRTTMVGADTRALPPELYEIVAQLSGPVDDVFLGLECEGAPLGWMYGPLFPGPVARKLSLARRLNGADAAEAMHIVSALGARRLFVYALGEEPWLQHVMATNYTPESYQLVQAATLARSCAEKDVEYHHLFGKATID
jgi:L-ascorbate metabolism protein UlaG (beta-lactamase superfamily)